MRRLLVVLTLAAGLVGCSSSTARHTPPLATINPCAAAAGGHGAMGICQPRRERHLLFTAPAPGAITWPDRSNNDPTLRMGAIAHAGHPAIVLKVNQGTSFVDRWFVPQARAARAAGLAVGGYDFVSTYTTSEALASSSTSCRRQG